MIKPRTLNHALALLLTLVTVPLLLGALGLSVIQVRQSQEMQQIQLMALAKTLSKAVENDFEHRKAQLEVIASSRIIERQDWQGLHMLGRTIAKQKPGSILFLLGPDGQQLANSNVPFGQPLPNPWKETQKEVLWEGKSVTLSITGLTQSVFGTGQVVYSDLFIGLLLKEPRMALAVPVVRNNQVLYVMGISFSPSAVQTLIDTAISVPGIRASVVDRQWKTVASNAASSSRTGDEIRPFALDDSKRSGRFELLAADGVQLRGAYALTQPSGFVVRTAVPLKGLLASLRDASPGWSMLALAAMVLSALLMGLISRCFAKPLKELHAAARDGRAPRGPATGVEEIDMIAYALRAGVQAEQQRRQDMALNLQRQHSEAALRKSNREKDEFLATLAHELRNPLAPIRTGLP